MFLFHKVVYLREVDIFHVGLCEKNFCLQQCKLCNNKQTKTRKSYTNIIQTLKLKKNNNISNCLQRAF